jgi:phospholipase A1/A2
MSDSMPAFNAASVAGTRSCPARPPRMMRRVLVSALVLAAGAARAQDSMQACAAIDDDRARLACYDRAQGRAPAKPPVLAAPLPAMPAAAPAMSAPPAADAPAAAGAVHTADDSHLARAWSFNPDSERYLIKLYRPNYLAPVRWQSRTNDRPFTPLFTALEDTDGELDQIEAAFQISFKTRFWASDDRRFGAWFAYSQQSFWQVYNGDVSSPFRDTNYEPEIKLTWQPQWRFGGFDWQLLSLGYNHESNGRADPISRSWDRLVAEIGIEQGDFALLLRPWLRIDDESNDKDNPDITDYYGYGDITAVYKLGEHSFTLMGRGNPAEQKGALRLTWMTPPLLGPLRGYVVGFAGYGDTLLDYNFKQNAVSAGVALNDLLDR